MHIIRCGDRKAIKGWGKRRGPGRSSVVGRVSRVGWRRGNTRGGRKAVNVWDESRGRKVWWVSRYLREAGALKQGLAGGHVLLTGIGISAEAVKVHSRRPILARW